MIPLYHPADNVSSPVSVLFRRAPLHLASRGAGGGAGSIRELLEGCLLTDQEMAAGEVGWLGLEDPFPKWILDTGEGEGLDEAGSVHHH